MLLFFSTTRNVAQFGSAPEWGSGGRKFESCRSDQKDAGSRKGLPVLIDKETLMRFVIQRVKRASVTVDGKITGKIEKGFMVLVGVCQEDTKEIADKMVRKMTGLRIFEDKEGKTNLSLETVGGSLLLVSQFTLYADCKKGNRPSFINAGSPDHAEALYDYIVDQCREKGFEVGTGVFGAEMDVELINDGPFTILLDSDTL